MLRMARHAHATTGMKNLCLAGGVALNCVANGRLLREGPFERIWVQPAAGDAGGAVGAALLAWYDGDGNSRAIRGGSDAMAAGVPRARVRRRRDRGVPAQPKASPYHPLDDRARATAEMLADGGVVGWFQGRMEFGPRALGARSILGDARSPTMQSTMNLKIKFRESFRPFAPSVLAREGAPTTSSSTPTRRTCCWSRRCARRCAAPRPTPSAAKWGIERLNVPRSTIPAVTHVDYSARVQTVTRGQRRLLRSAARVRRPDRLRGGGEHLVQRARRADRLHARRRLPLLHAHRDGPPGARPLPPRRSASSPPSSTTRTGARATSSTDGRGARPDRHAQAAQVRLHRRRGLHGARDPVRLAPQAPRAVLRVGRWPARRCSSGRWRGRARSAPVERGWSRWPPRSAGSTRASFWRSSSSSCWRRSRSSCAPSARIRSSDGAIAAADLLAHARAGRARSPDAALLRRRNHR